MILFIIVTTILTLASSTEQDTSHCYQNRPKVIQDQLPECQDKLFTDFCSWVQCDPVENCDDDDDNKAIVQNVTGRGCCPACVEFIDEDQQCQVASKLKRCRNGLFCDPSTKTCTLPAKKNRCMTEAHNRRLVQKNNMKFYVKGNEMNPKEPMYFEIPYATDMDPVTCAAETGNYELKQCRGAKCFCVDPLNGQFTFGLAVKDSTQESAKNLTCKCADYFQDRLVTNRVDETYMEHWADIHQKCDTAGNYEKLQCINQTCFCTDETTGRPNFEHAAIYGALSSLSCFDTDKAKKLLSKDADVNYQSGCEQQLKRTQELSLHFTDKGTKLRGLDRIACSFDGKFAAKQCSPEACNCVTPDDCQPSMGGATYSVDRAGGKDGQMTCRCARERYYASTEQKGYNRMQCEGNTGNFKAYQNFENGKESFCVDENGSRISKVFIGDCLDDFRQSYDGRLLNEQICLMMRKSLTDGVLNNETYYGTDKASEYAPTETHDRPTNLYCDNTQNALCKCDVTVSQVNPMI